MIARGLVEHGARTYIIGRDAKACDAAAADLSAKGGVCRALAGDLSTVGRSRGGRGGAEFTRRPARHFGQQCRAACTRRRSINSPRRAGTTLPTSISNRFSSSRKNCCRHCAPRRASRVSPASSTSDRWAAHASGPRRTTPTKRPRRACIICPARWPSGLGPENITVNAIAPGFFASRMTQIPEAQLPAVLNLVPRRRLGKPEDIVGAVLYLASEAGSFVTGAVIPVSGGMTL